MKWPFFERLKKSVGDPVKVVKPKGETFVFLKTLDEVNAHFTKRRDELRDRHAEELQDLREWLKGEMRDLHEEWAKALGALSEKTITERDAKEALEIFDGLQDIVQAGHVDTCSQPCEPMESKL